MADLPHPDANLIMLGQQFEAAKVTANKLDLSRGAAFEVYKAALRTAGLSDDRRDWTADDMKRDRSIYRSTGYKAASEAFNEAHGECIRLMKAIHRKKATTLEGFAVKVAAIAFDQSDFDLGTPEPEDVAERMLYRLAKDMAKVVKGSARKAAQP